MKAFLIYPHQLFEDTQHLKAADIIFLIEEPLFFSEFKFHKQKLILHRASMKAYEQYLKEAGFNVVYIEHHDTLPLEHYKVKHITFYDVVDDWLNSKIEQMAQKLNLEKLVLESPMFLTPTAIFKKFFAERSGKRKYFMNDFYIWQRKRLSILIENGAPIGGKWSFDSDNRKKLPRDVVAPNTFSPNNSSYVVEARLYVEKHFPNDFGDTQEFWCPINHTEAREHFKKFLSERLNSFGPYEDATTQSSPAVFHSAISPLLNNGLLTPNYVIAEALSFAQKHGTPLASLEGFIRQIIGWREYIRAMYILEGRKIRSSNYFKAHKALPKSLWSGTTGLPPIDHHVEVLKKYAYTHHIPRLMILGNFMNLCGIKPNDVYSWFMEMYIDAYDWVMVPNVYSMALYADGGILTTKPYIASSNYIQKMSDFGKGAWNEIFDALFWNFVGNHYEQLHTEGRLGFIGVQYAKMPREKRDVYSKIARSFLESQRGY